MRVTLAELEQHDDQIIDEAAINDWLDHIYSDSQLKSAWQAEYTRVTRQAELYSRTLLPFNSSDQK